MHAAGRVKVTDISTQISKTLLFSLKIAENLWFSGGKQGKIFDDFYCVDENFVRFMKVLDIFPVLVILCFQCGVN